MEIKKAFEILGLDNNCHKITSEILKKQYHIKSLQHHPDKNGNTLESTIKFREINEAYLLLSSLFIEDKDNQSQTTPSHDYTDLLNSFMSEFGNKKYLHVLKDIIVNCSYKMFENMSKSYSMEIYTFLSKNKYIFHLTQEVLSHVLEIIHNKEIQNIIINPSIDYLFDNNVYKLNYKNALYFVPLWHHEVYFDEKETDTNEMDSTTTEPKRENEFMVTCVPVLPNNIVIDEENNFIVYLEVVFDMNLLYKKGLYFHLGKKEFCVPLKELFVRQTQTFLFKKQGISKIKDEIDNVEEKSDIVVTITFVEETCI